jgi:hypothetical protein
MWLRPHAFLREIAVEEEIKRLKEDKKTYFKKKRALKRS